MRCRIICLTLRRSAIILYYIQLALCVDGHVTRTATPTYGIHPAPYAIRCARMYIPRIEAGGSIYILLSSDFLLEKMILQRISPSRNFDSACQIAACASEDMCIYTIVAKLDLQLYMYHQHYSDLNGGNSRGSCAYNYETKWAWPDLFALQVAKHTIILYYWCSTQA